MRARHCKTTIRLNANRNQEVHIKCTGSNCNQEQMQPESQEKHIVGTEPMGPEEGHTQPSTKAYHARISGLCKECAYKINKGAPRATCSGYNQDWKCHKCNEEKASHSKSSKTLSRNRNQVTPSN